MILRPPRSTRTGTLFPCTTLFRSTEIRCCVEQIGAIHCGGRDWASVNQNPFFCADPARLPELEALIDALRSEGDSIGAKLYVEATKIPPGLGEPVFDQIGRAHV